MPSGSEASQAPILSPTNGWICDSSQASSLRLGEDDLTDLVAVDLALRRDFLAPALDQAAEQRFGVEQLVDDGVAGDRRRSEPLKGGQGLGLARRDPAGEADRQRRTAR